MGIALSLYFASCLLLLGEQEGAHTAGGYAEASHRGARAFPCPGLTHEPELQQPARWGLREESRQGPSGVTGGGGLRATLAAERGLLYP